MATITSGTTSTGQTVSSGSILTVAAGGTIASYAILSGGSAVISGVDSGTTISAGGTEIISSGFVSGDAVYGQQTMAIASAGTVSNEVIYSGGGLSLTQKGEYATGITIMTGGTIGINGSATVNNAVIEGGALYLESAKANATGSLVFSGAGTIVETSVISAVIAGTGVLATISGFGAGDVIELDNIGSGATLTSLSTGGFTTLSVAGGLTESGYTETFTFAGTGESFALNSITGGGYQITGTAATLAAGSVITIASGVSSGGLAVTSGVTLEVLAGGTITTADILSGGIATIIGTDSGSTIALGGTETVGSGSVGGNVSGDAVYGTQLVIGSSSVVQNEIVYNGGTLDLFIKSAAANAVTLEAGAVMNISGAAVANGLVINGGSVVLQSAKAELANGLTFTGAGQLIESAVISASTATGDQAVISGFGAGDTIALTGIGTGATLASATAGGNTVLSIAGGSLEGGFTESFTFAGSGLDLVMNTIAGGGDYITIGTTSGGSTTFAGGSISVSGTTDFTNIGTGAIITGLTTVGGNEIMTLSGGSSMGSDTVAVTFAGTGNYFGLTTDGAGTGEVLSTIAQLTSFTAGDLVVSVVGDDDDSADYTDNQGTAIVLEEIDPTTGKIVGEMILPQNTSGANNAFSGEYGSSSEGILQLSADGKSLVIAGYGINAATYNEGGAAVYGNAALAQTTSLTDQTQYTAVARVIADIGYNGTIDTSTALYNVFNTNNPRSVTTVDGTSFYISGQGVKGDTTGGLFVANDGASSATGIDTANDTRTVEIYDGKLYLSQNSSTGTANVATFGDLPTGAATPTILSGINLTIALTAAQENSVNASAVGTNVSLSPEEYFFANATTLYIADGGNPKAGGLGDGGLQKWVLDPTTGQWNLAYTLSDGLNLVKDTGAAGTTGLIGLTGVVHADGTVTFYATNATIGDLDQTYLYTITDTVSATTAAVGESFAVVTTASPDTNVRGIAQAPSAPTNVTIASGQTSAGLTVSTGSTLDVLSGGSITGAVVLSGGTATIAAGGSDTGSMIVADGGEIVYGTATGDNVYGTQIVSGGVSNETVYYGADLQIAAGGTATGLTTEVNALLEISGSVSNLVISGGNAVLETGNASLTGVTFAGIGEIAELTGTNGVSGVISGFAGGDVIDLTQMGTASVLTSAVSGGNTIETVTSGGVAQSFTLAGTFAPGAVILTSDTSSGVEITIISSGGSTSSGGTGSSTSGVVSSGQTSAGLIVSNGGTLNVLAGGTVTAPVVLSGGIATINGTDTGAVISSGGVINLNGGAVETSATIMAGGTEQLLGALTATGDQVYGLQEVTGTTGAVLTGETIHAGGEVDLFFKTNTLDNSTILSGGLLAIDGNATGYDLTLAGGTIEFESPKANITGTLDFASGTLLVSGAVNSTGYGDLAIINNFGAGDIIELDATAIGTGATMTSALSGGNTVITLTGGTALGAQVDKFTFAGTADISMLQLSGGGVELLANTSIVTGTANGGTIGAGQEQLITSGGVASGTTITNGGTQVVTNGGTVTSTFVEHDSTQIISSGGVASGTTVGDPSVQTIASGGSAFDTDVVAGGEQDVYGSVTSTTVENGGIEVLFTGGTAAHSYIENGGIFVLDGGTATDTTLAAGATLDIETLAYSAGMTGAISGGELVISAGGTAVFSMALDGDYSGDTIHVTEATDGSTALTLCFYPGTRIATPQGEVAVEDLCAGDLVLTANGAKPVRWIGQSHIATRFADKQRTLPVRITAGALGNNLPVRDLLLSPDHAIFIGGILAQAAALVNDVTILREANVPAQFTYYHVELANHELLLAEGVAAESFVDNVDRMHFHNWDARTTPATPIHELPYPRAKSERQLPAALRATLAIAKRA